MTDLWTSPSKPQRPRSAKGVECSRTVSEPSDPRDTQSRYDHDEAREAALRMELDSVRKTNQVIEGILESLAHAKDSMEVSKPLYLLLKYLIVTW